MLYNKSQLNKTSDKKLMRKVKSKWVVVSTAAFAAGGFALASQGADAHADTVNNASQSQTTQQSTTNSTTQATQQNTAATLASNDLTQGQVTGTANAGNTVATGTNNDNNDQILNGQSPSNVTSQSAAIKYSGFTDTRAQDVDPTHYTSNNINNGNAYTQAYRQGSNDYNDYRYGIVGELQTPANNTSGGSWGTQRNTSWNAAYNYQQDKSNNAVKSDSQIQSQSSINSAFGSFGTNTYAGKLYTAAYIDAKHIDENETAKGEYRARAGLSRPDDSNVTPLATSWNTNNSQGYNYDQNDANRTYNAFNQALTNPDSSKDYIGISSQVYDVYKLAAQQAEAGVTDTSKLDAAYKNLQQTYTSKYVGTGMLNGMPVGVQTQSQTRSQNPVWADGTQYGLGANAGVADAKAKKAMTLGTDVNYNAGYTTAFNNYFKGLDDANKDLSFDTTQTPDSIMNTPLMSESVGAKQSPNYKPISYPAGYDAGYNDAGVALFNDYHKGISYVFDNVTNLFSTGLTANDYQGKSEGWQSGVDGVINYWNQQAPSNMKIPMLSTHMVSSSTFLNWAKIMEVSGFGASPFTSRIDAILAKVKAITNNSTGLYTATYGKSLTLTSNPSSAINAGALKTFDVFMQAKASGNSVSEDYSKGLLNQAYSRLADNLTQYAMNDSLMGNIAQGDSGIQQALSGTVGTGSPSDALNAAYEYNVAKGYQDASQGVAYNANANIPTNGAYSIGYNSYKDIKISVDNFFGATEQPYNGDTNTYATINQAVSTSLSNMFPSAGQGNFAFETYLPNSNMNYSGGDLVKFIPAYVSALKGISTSTPSNSTYGNALNSSVAPYVDPTTAATNIANIVQNALSKGAGSGFGADEVGITLNNGNYINQSGSNTVPYNGYAQDFALAALSAFVSGAAGNTFAPNQYNIDIDDATTNTVYSALKSAYQLGQQVGNGANDAINGKRYTSSDNVSDAQYNANLGALQALTEINNGIQQNHSAILPAANTTNSFLDNFAVNGGPGAGNALSSESSYYSPSLRKTDALPATSYGYQLVYTTIGMNLTTGAYQFAFNVARPTQVGMNYVYDLSKQAFDNAKLGRNVYGTTNTISQWDALSGIQTIANQAWSDTQAGINYVNDNAKVPTDGSAAYQAAAQAYYDASMNHNPTSAGALYMDIYNSYSHMNGGAPYAEGVCSFVQPGIAVSGNNFNNYRFQVGKTDGQTAYEAAMKADATMPSTFTPIQQAAFQAVRDAIHNAFAGDNDKVSTFKFQGVGNGDQNTVYQLFYNYTQANLKSTNDLIAQFQDADDTDSNASDLHAYFNVYQNYMNGFKAGEGNEANPNANDTFINAGYNDGLKVYNAVNDFMQSPVGNDALTDAASDALNAVISQSTAPRTYNTRLEREAYRLTHNELSAVAQKVVSDFQNPTGAVSYVGADAKSKVEQGVYISLSNTFESANMGNVRPVSSAYNTEGLQAYQRLLTMAQATITNPSSTAFQIGNDVVYHAVEDGLHGYAKKDNQGLAYDTFYKMAKTIKDNQDAQAKAQSEAAQADADRDAANKRADQSDANAKQAEADKTAAQQAQAQAESDKANAESAQAQAQAAQADAEAKRDAAIKAQQQAEADRDDAIKAQQAAQMQSQSDNADKDKAEQDKANAIEAQQRAENARDAAIKAQQDAEAQRDDAVKAQQQAEADKDAAIQAQKVAEDKATQATDAMNKADAERDAANAANQQAHADKATALAKQADAEAIAKQAEQDKATAQAEMQQAKADRDKAVIDRDNAIKQMNDAIADANQKVANAQKAEADAQAQVNVAQSAQADAQRRADEATAEAATAKKIADDAVIGKQDADARAQKATDDMNKAIADRDAAQAETQKATDAMNDAIKAKNDAIAQAQQANADKQAAINKANADIADANQRIANAIQAQADAQAKAKQAQKDADDARSKASQDVADANAKAQAEIDKAKAEAQAEVAKAQSDNTKADAVHKADEVRELREKEHQQKVNYKHGYELALADARNGLMKPAAFLRRENQFFVRGYEQGFMAYMNKHMPKYVTNKLDIHVYDGDTFTTKNRGKLVDTKHAQNFRVYGVTFNKFGYIRYSIGNGKFITANRKFVVPTYFAPANKAKNIKVRLGRTILVHKNKGFSDHKHLRVLHSGDVIRVRRVIKFHGITRFVVKGGYITSNRLFVKLAK